MKQRFQGPFYFPGESKFAPLWVFHWGLETDGVQNKIKNN